MAFGTFYVEEREIRPKKAPARALASPKRGQTASCTLSVLLIGRTGGGIRDYLCSMAVNMDGSAGNAGLAFYTQDAQTIAGKVAAKKELESKLMEKNAIVDYEAEPEYRAYSYRISPAGRQSISVELAIDCITVKGIQENLLPEKAYDAVWLLTDFPATEPERTGEYGPVNQWLKQQSAVEGGVLCCVIMDCLEHLGGDRRISSGKTQVRYPKEVRSLAVGRCEQVYPALQGSGVFPAKLFLVQVYGGFSFSHWTEDEKMVLQTGNGAFASYLPSVCHMPLYETVEWARKSEKHEFFRLSEGRALADSIKTVSVQDAGGMQEAILLKQTEKRDDQEVSAHETQA